MVGTRQGTNTSGKEKKKQKKVKRSSKDYKVFINVHGVNMKGIVTRGMGDGQAGGPSLIE